MSQSLNVELTDTSYVVLEKQAVAAGKSPEQLAADVIESECRAWRSESATGPPRSDLQRRAARERFESHFGSVDLGYSTGADNAIIDADLAREYSATHEGA